MASGMLLWNMAFLHKNTIVSDAAGTKWYVRTREAACQELALSKYKYDEAIEHLREAGFIETVPAAAIGYLKLGMRATAFRVTEKAMAAISAVENQAISGPDVQAISGPMSQAISGPHSRASKKYNKEVLIKVGNQVSAHFRDADGKPTYRSIEVFYRESFKIFDPDYFHGTWPRRQYAFCKLILKQIGPDKVEHVIRHTVSNWTAFREYALSGTTLKITERPDVLTLLAHVAAAVEFSEGKDKPGGKAKFVGMSKDILK